ncbi:MAG: VOC family protein [Hamadaea sp.]|uniref:VOC family protein n=1 Tax=Hamadaea sp. NPDC050747 TaxID=3155789 RepID=UPI0017BE6A10|nr:VOC family protein [Hamadaea sp.]NUR49807.1 VOC family protein [Hamadaea sp.]NUT08065.1 VOC family protein [Hamadaea sp.]
MTTRLNPYLNFPGSAREAMEFYQEVLGGDLKLNTFGEYGSDDAATKDQIMHALLETPAGFTIMASDLPPGMEHQPGQNISISVSGEDADALRGYWEKLAAKGTVTMQLEKQMWGDEFGMVVDQFGVPWMIDIVHPQ